MKIKLSLIKAIPNYPGYFISKNGNVYTTKVKGAQGRMGNDFIKMGIRLIKGYRRVGLRNNTGKKRNFKVNRLVAMAFIANPNNYPIVLHKNNIKTADNYKNLIWGTHKMNSQQMVNEGRQNSPTGSRNAATKYTIELCQNIIDDKLHGLSIGDIQIKYNISHKQVCRIIKRETFNSKQCLHNQR